MEKLTSLQYCLLIIQYSFLKALLVALGTEEKKLCFVDFRIDYTTIQLCDYTRNFIAWQSHPIALASSILSSRSKIVLTAVCFKGPSIEQQTIYEQLQVWLTLEKKHRALFHACAAVDSLLSVSYFFFLMMKL